MILRYLYVVLMATGGTRTVKHIVGAVAAVVSAAAVRVRGRGGGSSGSSAFAWPRCHVSSEPVMAHPIFAHPLNHPDARLRFESSARSIDAC